MIAEVGTRVDFTNLNTVVHPSVSTSNVTGRHRGRSTSARVFAGTWRPLMSVITTPYYVEYLSSSSVVSNTFSALCMYSTFGHHPHPLGYLCAKFCSFLHHIAELAHREKSHTHILIIFPLNLHAITITQMLSSGGEGYVTSRLGYNNVVDHTSRQPVRLTQWVFCLTMTNIEM